MRGVWSVKKRGNTHRGRRWILGLGCGMGIIFCWLSHVAGLCAAEAGRAGEREVRVGFYNVRNYLSSEKKIKGGLQVPEKAREEVLALVAQIAAVNVDVLLLCEIGGMEQLRTLSQLLKKEGCAYPWMGVLDAADEQRRLAYLSRYPISREQSQTKLYFMLEQIPFQMQRGILDLEVQVEEIVFRVLGVHLKSKRPVPYGESRIRRSEARLLRGYTEKILRESKNPYLILLGDFNDTRESVVIKEVMGEKAKGDSLFDIRLTDHEGNTWTHYWAHADVYSRVDYIFVNRPVLKLLDRENCGIGYLPTWYQGSDHRLLYLTLKWVPGNY